MMKKINRETMNGKRRRKPATRTAFAPTNMPTLRFMGHLCLVVLCMIFTSVDAFDGEIPSLYEDLDLNLCLESLYETDTAPRDAKLDNAEHLQFLYAMGLPYSDERPTSLLGKFHYLACLCLKRGGDPDCCVGDNARIDIEGLGYDTTAHEYSVPPEDFEYFHTVCLYSQRAIEVVTRDSDRQDVPAPTPPSTPQPTGFTFGATKKPTPGPTAAPTTAAPTISSQPTAISSNSPTLSSSTSAGPSSQSPTTYDATTVAPTTTTSSPYPSPTTTAATTEPRERPTAAPLTFTPLTLTYPIALSQEPDEFTYIQQLASAMDNMAVAVLEGSDDESSQRRRLYLRRKLQSNELRVQLPTLVSSIKPIVCPSIVLPVSTVACQEIQASVTVVSMSSPQPEIWTSALYTAIDAGLLQSQLDDENSIARILPRRGFDPPDQRSNENGTTTTTNLSSSRNKMSTGAAVGILLAVVGTLGVVMYVLFDWWERRKLRRRGAAVSLAAEATWNPVPHEPVTLTETESEGKHSLTSGSLAPPSIVQSDELPGQDSMLIPTSAFDQKEEDILFDPYEQHMYQTGMDQQLIGGEEDTTSASAMSESSRRLGSTRRLSSGRNNLKSLRMASQGSFALSAPPNLDPESPPTEPRRWSIDEGDLSLAAAGMSPSDARMLASGRSPGNDGMEWGRAVMLAGATAAYAAGGDHYENEELSPVAAEKQSDESQSTDDLTPVASQNLSRRRLLPDDSSGGLPAAPPLVEDSSGSGAGSGTRNVGGIIAGAAAGAAVAGAAGVFAFGRTDDDEPGEESEVESESEVSSEISSLASDSPGRAQKVRIARDEIVAEAAALRASEHGSLPSDSDSEGENAESVDTSFDGQVHGSMASAGSIGSARRFQTIERDTHSIEEELEENDHSEGEESPQNDLSASSGTAVVAKDRGATEPQTELSDIASVDHAPFSPGDDSSTLSPGASTSDQQVALSEIASVDHAPFSPGDDSSALLPGASTADQQVAVSNIAGVDHAPLQPERDDSLPLSPGTAAAAAAAVGGGVIAAGAVVAGLRKDQSEEEEAELSYTSDHLSSIISEDGESTDNASNVEFASSEMRTDESPLVNIEDKAEESTVEAVIPAENDSTDVGLSTDAAVDIGTDVAVTVDPGILTYAGAGAAELKHDKEVDEQSSDSSSHSSNSYETGTHESSSYDSEEESGITESVESSVESSALEAVTSFHAGENAKSPPEETAFASRAEVVERIPLAASDSLTEEPPVLTAAPFKREEQPETGGLSSAAVIGAGAVGAAATAAYGDKQIMDESTHESGSESDSESNSQSSSSSESSSTSSGSSSSSSSSESTDDEDTNGTGVSPKEPVSPAQQVVESTVPGEPGVLSEEAALVAAPPMLETTQKVFPAEDKSVESSSSSSDSESNSSSYFSGSESDSYSSSRSSSSLESEPGTGESQSVLSSEISSPGLVAELDELRRSSRASDAGIGTTVALAVGAAGATAAAMAPPEELNEDDEDLSEGPHSSGASRNESFSESGDDEDDELEESPGYKAENTRVLQSVLWELDAESQADLEEGSRITLPRITEEGDSEIEMSPDQPARGRQFPGGGVVDPGLLAAAEIISSPRDSSPFEGSSDSTSQGSSSFISDSSEGSSSSEESSISTVSASSIPDIGERRSLIQRLSSIASLQEEVKSPGRPLNDDPGSEMFDKPFDKSMGIASSKEDKSQFSEMSSGATSASKDSSTEWAIARSLSVLKNADESVSDWKRRSSGSGQAGSKKREGTEDRKKPPKRKG